MVSNDATQHRAAITAADGTTYDDAHFDPTLCVDCNGWETVIVYGKFVAGASPTVVFEVLMKGPVANNWIRQPTLTTASADGVMSEIKAYGRKLFFRVNTISGAPTNVSIFVGGGKPFRADGTRQS